MSNGIDDDIKVWIAARTVAQKSSEFTVHDLLGAMKPHFKPLDAKKMESFITGQCVANVAGDGDRHYNYLFRVGPNKYRLFRAGDPVEYTHAGAPNEPAVHRVPEQFRSLYASSKALPPEIRPVDAAPRSEPAHKPSGRKKTTAVVEKRPEPAHEAAGLVKLGVGDLDMAVPANQARTTIFDLLFLEFGRIGSRLEHNRGASFSLQEPVAGSAHTLQNLYVKLPSGASVSHVADIVLETESPTRTLFVDVIESTARPDEIKALAYDAIHLRKDPKERYAILIILQVGPAGMLREQIEAICYAYDHFYGIEADETKNAAKFYGLKTHVGDWLRGKVNGVAKK